jgi:phytoene dehydrogenase-like protein
MEGGCYPQGGAETMAKELVPVIQSHGGKVLIRAPVREISVNQTSGRVEGVVMNDASGTFIPCKEAVVSSAGYFNTYHRLLQDERTKDKFAIPKAIGVGQSAGFVMCNIGIAADAKVRFLSMLHVWIPELRIFGCIMSSHAMLFL